MLDEGQLTGSAAAGVRARCAHVHLAGPAVTAMQMAMLVQDIWAA